VAWKTDAFITVSAMSIRLMPRGRARDVTSSLQVPNQIDQERLVAEMKRFLIYLVTAVILTRGVAHAQQPLDIRTVLDGRMLPQEEVAAFERSETLYPVRVVSRGAVIGTLPIADRRLENVEFQIGDKRYDLFDYLALNRVAGLLILKDGKIALEDYELGAGPDTRWASFSMAKSVTSTLIGAALEDRFIASLDDPVTRYVPALRGGVYDGVSIRNVLQMASGVRWNETYTDPKSDCRKLTDAQLGHRPGASIAYMKNLSRAAPAGSVWNYNSGETNIVGAVVEGATHMSLAAYLSRKLWSPLGMERDAFWWTESKGGMGLGGAGLSATLRDYVRFGLFVLSDGVIDGHRTVPEGWFQQAGRGHRIGDKSVDYGYLWWPLPAGDSIHAGAFEARGIFGQHLYINPSERLVIVVLSARPKPTGSTVLDDAAFFAAVARTLHRQQ
jgi:CubicO group peptidase (beta-lactamase class C family)